MHVKTYNKDVAYIVYASAVLFIFAWVYEKRESKDYIGVFYIPHVKVDFTWGVFVF